MALTGIYTQFLKSPTTAVLADGVAIHYVPTLTTINEPTAVIKHLAAQSKLLHKKSENVISAVEGSFSISLEVETVIEFVSGGGALVPGLDDNFLADKIVTFPLVHVVQFDGQQKISQIRLYWDQGSLLKQLDIIGARGRNWPIRDGTDQIRLITRSAKTEVDTTTSRRSTVSRGSAEDARSHSSSITSVTADRRELSLFQPREEQEQLTPKKPLVAPRASAKPPTRNLTDILASDEVAMPAPGTPSNRPVSPRKLSNGQKGGAGKNYHPIRLFEEKGEDILQSPEKPVNPRKYNHFEFGDGEGASKPNIPDRTKHSSQWSFADFNTPEKPKVKLHTQNVRTFGWSDDEESETSPVTRPIVHQPRPDARTHFAFNDASDSEGTPVKNKLPQTVQNSMGLYKDNLTDDLEEAQLNVGKVGKQPLSTVTNVDLDHRRKDFESHFEIQDNSPAPNKTIDHSRGKLDQNQAKVLKTLNATWDMYDQSPDSASKKENQYRIKNLGDGMGGRRAANSESHWGFDGGEDI